MQSMETIAATLAGYDPQALSADTVNAFLSHLVTPVTERETVGIFQALGRVLADDVISPISVPPHDNSAMDGYAFDGSQLAKPSSAQASAQAKSQSPLALKVVGTALAGKAWTGVVQPGECVKIMTGAIMPSGLDTVVPQEFVMRRSGPSDSAIGAWDPAEVITIPVGLLQVGDNRRKLGEDLKAGQPALQKGQLLTPAALGLLASLGIEHLTVWRKLRVAYFSTGDEILSLGELPREGAVFDSNRYTVFGLLTRLGCEVIDLGVVRDEPALLEAAFMRAALVADAIITSGGVSVGEADYTKTMMKKLGDVAFWKIAMRPGRPMAVGRILREKLVYNPHAESVECYKHESKSSSSEAAVLFGLPGNPVAVMVTFLAFVRPALLKMMGSTGAAPPRLKARSAEAIRKKPGRTEYQRGTVSTADDGSLRVQTTGNQGSGVLSSMVRANGLIVLHHAQGNVAIGDEVDVMMLDGVI